MSQTIIIEKSICKFKSQNFEKKLTKIYQKLVFVPVVLQTLLMYLTRLSPEINNAQVFSKNR